MKSAPLFLLIGSALLASCNSTERQAKAAVSDYISSGLGEPGYYRPEKFTLRPYTRKDSVAYAAQLAELTAAADTVIFRDEAGHILPRPTAAAANKAQISTKLASDATPIATYVYHTYREQSKTGRTSRDSGEFIVYPNGNVITLVPRRVREARLKQLQAQKQ
ncbi:hypothetical protein [Hymenobacter cavernae]|uniref:Uncharacterized protein n=1 Tax=Hymenobacter cavernae TaxID=2044852 RepID=A0ABQ1UKM4_9BACT|nr:hypothetical protein [Hymenobacter cavernae]GGF19197.1 hypothetical protein GCM10011383_33420 [Hymenobacter cavernae]